MGELDREADPELVRIEFLHTSTPVEGCEFLPYVVVKMPNGEVKSSEMLEAVKGRDPGLQYQWYRCSQRHVCSNGKCRRTAQGQFTPPYKIVPENEGLDPDVLRETFFCSRKCLAESWQRLRGLQIREHAQKKERAGADRPDAGSAELADLDDMIHTSPIGLNKTVTEPEANPLERYEVGWNRSFTPSKDEVGHALQVVCRYARRLSNGDLKTGPPLVAESAAVVETPPPPPERMMFNLFTRESHATRPRWAQKHGTFRVLSYNCLAEIYANSGQFPYCPAWALAWSYRCRNLTREIQAYAADILCLQEVQADYYADHFQPIMAHLGFQSTFKSKTREAMGKKGKIDGCATFWLAERFNLREQHDVEFNTAAYNRGLKDSRGLKLLMKGNIGQLTVLDERDGSGCLIVANTHIYWDPDKSEIKVFQVDTFLREIESLVSRLGGHTAVVFAADLNSPPDSAVHELVSTGTISAGVHEEIAENACSILDSCRLTHGLQLRSSYACMGYEPAFTNYTKNFVGTLDYVFYSENTLVCVALLEAPDETSVLADGSEGMPNTRWSSDHVALMAEFQRM